jgi:hypothetical protein
MEVGGTIPAGEYTFFYGKGNVYRTSFFLYIRESCQ